MGRMLARLTNMPVRSTNSALAAMMRFSILSIVFMQTPEQNG